MRRQGEWGRGDSIRSLDWRKVPPFRTDASSNRQEEASMHAAHCRAEPAFERSVPALTYHRLVFVARAFDIGPMRPTVPPLDGLHLPHVRAAMRAVDAKLTGGGPGGPLAAESWPTSWLSA